jgi:hypothetical protein
MIEYKADGGRIGYREGSLANYPLRTMGGGPTPQQTLPDGTPYNPGFPAPGRQPGGNQNSGITTLSDGTVYNPGRPAPGSNVGLGYDKPMPQGIQPPGELAYDATNTSIYGSSAASFSPKTIMNQSGNQVQAGFGKTPGMQPGGLTLNPGATIDPTMGKPLPDYMRPGNIPGTNTPYSTLRGEQPLPDFMRPGGVVHLNQPFMGKGGPEAFDNVPNRITDMRYRDPGPGIGTGGGLEEAYLAAQKSAQEARKTMPNAQVVLPGEMTFETFSKGFNPSNPSGLLGAPLQAQAQPMPFAQQANSSSPMAQIAGMADGGRMGYNEGTPEMGMIDPNKAKQAKQMIGMGADQDLISTITGLTKEQVQFLMTENKADGGRIGYAMGDTAEQNAIQASGIMNLPLNENPAGITELDLRETGGFIPPVGVKEKEDDIPAMLSNNEFVFTADAVRGMGDGNVNKGAQRMYDMMKKLEQGGRV